MHVLICWGLFYCSIIHQSCWFGMSLVEVYVWLKCYLNLLIGRSYIDQLLIDQYYILLNIDRSLINIFEGAGKTTTFGMLTGDLSITEGTAYLDGFNIQSNLKQVLHHSIHYMFTFLFLQTIVHSRVYHDRWFFLFIREYKFLILFALPLKIFVFLTGSTENWLLSSGM